MRSGVGPVKEDLYEVAQDDILFTLEEVPCDFCTTWESTFVLQGKDWRYGLPGTWTLVRCSRCGLVYLNPRPVESDLAKTYPKSYVQHRIPDDYVYVSPKLTQTGRRQWIKTRLAQRYYGLPDATGGGSDRFVIGLAQLYARALGLTWFPPVKREESRALDIGCGSGTVLRQLREMGWDAVGVETDVEAAARAESYSNCEVLVGKIPGLHLEKESFDFVVLQHVLEHLPSPLATLREVADLLRPGGYARITVPHFTSVESKLLGESWYALELPRHLYHFGQSQLVKYIEHCGLQVTHMQFTSEGWGLLESLKNRSNKFRGVTEDGEGIVWKAGAALARGLSVLRLGGVMTAYCRKPV